MSDPVRIYLAARFNGGRGDTRSNNPHQQAAASEPYPYHLESYHYIGGGSIDDAVRYAKAQIFLDSGAFSMFTQGIEINLDEYGQFIRRNRDYIEIASNVDVIGRNKEAESYANQKRIEAMKLPVTVCPVHHARDDDRWLVKYLDEGYDYIFLGGMVPESTPYLIDWLDHVWDKYLALPDGTARVKIHGFGLTTFELMERYPWYSVDSTSWVQIAMFGGIILRTRKGTPRAFSISRNSSAIHDAGRSYWSLDAHTQELVRKRIEAEGFDVELLTTSYGHRDRWNIRVFREYSKELRPVFQRKQITFF